MVSIIIPTYNRAAALELVLPSYFRQSQVGEIIIVDDNSIDDYKPVIEKYRKTYPVPLIYVKNMRNLGAAGSRNIGISIASYEMILWGEDDVFLGDDYIEILSKYSKPDGNIAICGAIYYGLLPFYSDVQKEEIVNRQIKDSSTKELFDFRFFEGCYQKIIHGICEVPFGHALLLLPKSFYKNICYFEGYAVNGFREESDAQVQMLKDGNNIYYTSQTCCYHFPGDFSKKGGQHSDNRLKYEIYKIVNNCVFLNRHFNYLKKKFSLNGCIFSNAIAFAFHTIGNDFVILFKKIRRCFFNE